MPLVSVMCCQVVSVKSLSLIQRSPTDCGASSCVILTSEQLVGRQRLRWVAGTRGGGGETQLNRNFFRTNDLKIPL